MKKVFMTMIFTMMVLFIPMTTEAKEVVGSWSNEKIGTTWTWYDDGSMVEEADYGTNGIGICGPAKDSIITSFKAIGTFIDSIHFNNKDCKSLKTIDFSEADLSQVTSMDFSWCINLETINWGSNKLENLLGMNFENCGKLHGDLPVNSMFEKDPSDDRDYTMSFGGAGVDTEDGICLVNTNGNLTLHDLRCIQFAWGGMVHLPQDIKVTSENCYVSSGYTSNNVVIPGYSSATSGEDCPYVSICTEQPDGKFTVVVRNNGWYSGQFKEDFAPEVMYYGKATDVKFYAGFIFETHPDSHEFIYTGEPFKPAYRADLPTNAVEGKDYVISYSDNVEPGTAKITVTIPDGSCLCDEFVVLGTQWDTFTKTGVSTFTIKPIPVKKSELTCVWNDDKTDISLIYKDKELVQGVDYKLYIYEFKKKVEASVVLTGHYTCAKNAGGFTFTTTPNNADSQTIETPQKKEQKSFTKNGIGYQVTAAKKAVTVTKVNNTKSVTIPATVKNNGITYKVTGIKGSALKSCKKLSKLTVKANIQAKSVKAAVKQLQKKVRKQLTVKVTKNQYSSYRTALKGLVKKVTK